VYEYSISLWETSNLFREGHRIRLEVSSSNFPRFDRNLNTGEDSGFDDRPESAQQTIWHNQQRPSHLVLPVIPK
jgi:putative CocE/NonD family hydrolase